MELYSAALAVSLSFMGAWAAFTLAGFVLRSRPKAAGLARVCAGIAAAAWTVALGDHLLAGHRPGSANAMGPFEFAFEHPTLTLAGPAVAAVLWLGRRRR